MTFKQWQQVIMLITQVLIIGWLVGDAARNSIVQTPLAEQAAKLAWAVLAMVVINIAFSIGIVIALSIARRKEFKDEAADERDRAVNARSSRNAYFVLSVAGLGVLLLMAFGVHPNVCTYALFGGLMLACAAEGVSKLLYYRYG